MSNEEQREAFAADEALVPRALHRHIRRGAHATRPARAGLSCSCRRPADRCRAHRVRRQQARSRTGGRTGCGRGPSQGIAHRVWRSARPHSHLLQTAVRHRRPPTGLIFHSDRGTEYLAAPFRDTLVALGIQQGARVGGPGDNAHMESFFHSFRVVADRDELWKHFVTCEQPDHNGGCSMIGGRSVTMVVVRLRTADIATVFVSEHYCRARSCPGGRPLIPRYLPQATMEYETHE